MDAKSKYTAFERPYWRTICWEQIFEIHPRFLEITPETKRDNERQNATMSDRRATRERVYHFHDPKIEFDRGFHSQSLKTL